MNEFAFIRRRVKKNRAAGVFPIIHHNSPISKERVDQFCVTFYRVIDVSSVCHWDNSPRIHAETSI